MTVVLGSTGNLAHQIEYGAPADVFFAADERSVETLAARGAILSGTRVVYAQGRVILATARGRQARVMDLQGLLDPAIRRVAIANPTHAPYGRAAQQALRAAGIWDAVKPKLVYAENIRQALQYLQAGAAEAGLLALAVANAPEIEWVPVDASLYAPIDHAAGVVSRSPRPDLARAVIDFVRGPEGRAILTRHGLEPPGAR